MRKGKQIFFLIFVFINFVSFSQKTLSGKVTDSLGKPLTSANLLAHPKDTLQEVKFSITNQKGNYDLDLKAIPYTVTVNYMGYAKKPSKLT